MTTSIEHDEIARLHETIAMQLDQMVTMYDSRVLAAVLLGRAATLYNGLRLHKLITAEQVARIYEIAIETSLNDEMEAPTLKTIGALGSTKLN